MAPARQRHVATAWACDSTCRRRGRTRCLRVPPPTWQVTRCGSGVAKPASATVEPQNRIRPASNRSPSAAHTWSKSTPLPPADRYAAGVRRTNSSPEGHVFCARGSRHVIDRKPPFATTSNTPSMPRSGRTTAAASASAARAVDRLNQGSSLLAAAEAVQDCLQARRCVVG